MTVTGWIQIVVLVAVLTGLTPLLGGYMARVYQGERVALARWLGPVERLLYRGVSRRRRERAGLGGIRPLAAGVQRRELAHAVPDPPHAAIQPVQPAAVHALGSVGSVVQHGLVVRVEHELAVLRRRNDAVGLRADGGITVASFTSMATGMAVAVALIRGLARRGTDRLGNFWVDLVRSLLYVVVAALGRRVDRARRPRRPADARALPACPRSDRARADDRDRPGRLAGGDQVAVRRRRRVLQRQLGAPVREPDRRLEPRRDAADAARPRRVHGDVRTDDRPPSPGVGAVRRDARSCSSAAAR